ncbi:hypothetical protein LTR56_005519 [Elasticomyces elasticus]|nr:hypothetical protein LTR22_017905 [Elasticomyces elasticus]KAK3651711.1 hypothetical protein LTR56_005519 [Elasticomyces elasticus]KAK4912873.1 hypothetical protein LTR49_018729 [Elasticomyces elasticus]KAK5769190.1 hypothetical protein LTS12_000541 [Elasticomyces elasticus]
MGTISPPPLKRRKLSESQTLTSQDSGSRLTLFSHNVNGIAPYLQSSITSFFKPSGGSKPENHVPAASLRDFLRRHEWPHCLMLQEIKINPDDGATIRALEKAVASAGESDGPGYIVHLCLPSDKYNARGSGRKVYGVASIIRKDWYDKHVERLRSVSWDIEGRFSVIEVKGIGPRPLAIYNIYAVNGTESKYRDPGNGDVAGTRHDRKLQVHRLLQAECRALEADGIDVVLAGDLNIARTTLDGHPNLHFEDRFFAEPKVATKGEESPSDGLGMIDTFRLLHPTTKAYSYYPRGGVFGESCDRVDMILVSRSLSKFVAEAGILETQAERGPSDHVPLYVTLDFGRREQKDVS